MPIELNLVVTGLKLKTFCSRKKEALDESFGKWIEKHPDITIEEIKTPQDNTCFVLHVFYRVPVHAAHPYR